MADRSVREVRMDSILLHDSYAAVVEVGLALWVVLLVAAECTRNLRKFSTLLTVLGLAAAFYAAGRDLGDAVTGLVPNAIFKKPGATGLDGGMLTFDNVALFFRAFLMFAAMIGALWTIPVVEKWEKGKGEFWILYVSCVLGCLLLASSSNLLMIYLSLEFVSLTSYALSGVLPQNRKSAEASLKYFIYGAAASGVMLFGISILYGVTGTLDLRHIYLNIDNLVTQGRRIPDTMAAVVFGMIFVGFAYKIAAAPFHMWSPDVYEGAPTPVTAFFSIAPKAAGFAVLCRFVAPFMGDTSSQSLQTVWAIIIFISSVLSMTIGNLAAIFQNNLKRLLAYSGIAHAGYLLLGVYCAGVAPVSAGYNMGVQSVMFYVMVYGLMNAGAFLIAIILEERYGIQTVSECNGIGWKLPHLAVPMVIFLIALTGLPPTAGFVGKLYLFSGLIEKWDGGRGDNLAMILAVAGVVYSVISLFYYMRIVAAMFLKKGAEEISVSKEESSLHQILTYGLAFLVLLLGVYFTPLYTLTADCARAMFFPAR